MALPVGELSAKLTERAVQEQKIGHRKTVSEIVYLLVASALPVIFVEFGASTPM